MAMDRAMFIFELLFELIFTVVIEVIIVGPGYLVLRCIGKEPEDSIAGLVGIALWAMLGLTIWAAVKLL
jgi:hypothetical protein